MRRVLAIVGGCVLLLAACSSDPATTAQDGERSGRKKRDERSEGAKGDKQTKPGEKGSSGNEGGDGQADGVPAEVTQPPGAGNVDEGGFGDPTPSEVDPSLARASQTVADGESDSTKEGLTPAHAEIVGASVQGVGENVRLILRFGGQVPQESPDDKTYMVVGWGISAGGDESYGFSAQATDEGWEVYAGGKGKATKFPGEFTVDGNAVIMEIPWDYIGGPREFEWQTNSSWFRQLANTTHYSFDLCPDDDPAQFPGG